jgi:hypothetical protein
MKISALCTSDNLIPSLYNVALGNFGQRFIPFKVLLCFRFLPHIRVASYLECKPVTSENPANPIRGGQTEPDAGWKPDEQSAHPKPEVPRTPTQSQATASSHHCEISCNKKRDWIDKVSLGLEAFGLVVLIVYAIATIAIWSTNKKAADAAKSAADTADKTLKQSIADRRPYVTLRTIGTVKISYGKPIQVNVQMINWGKSLANGVTLAAHVWFGRDTNTAADQFLAQLPLVPQKADEQFLIPNIDGDKPASPSFIYTTITSGDQAPSHNAIQTIRHQDAGVMVAGRCWYKDTFGNWYRTDFCYETLLSGALSTCAKHNEIQ